MRAVGILLFLFSLSAWGKDPRHYECEAGYDEMGIPHLEVGSWEEHYYCFGFHHGKDRAWEMDYFRRVVHGQNSEVLGFAQLKQDLMMRLLNLSALGERLWSEMPAEKKKNFEDYARGVNAGFELGKRSAEFQKADYEPQEWKGPDSIKVLLLQAFDQTRKTFYRDYLEQKNIENWGKEASTLFDEDDMPWENNIIKEGEYSKKPVQTVQVPHQEYRPWPKLWSDFPSVFGQETGSNNWAVSAKKSLTGKAIFANDPHLDLKTPMFWYWIHLKRPDGEVIGASLPGAPVVASGTNGKLAWGLTNSYFNSGDVIFLDEKVETQGLRPLVWVKFLFFKIPFFFKSFERLPSGHPILPLETTSPHKIALRWSGFTLKAEDVYSVLDIISTQNVDEANEVFKKINLASWNFVFADMKGDIGYRMVGKVYRHAEKPPYGMPSMSLKEFLHEEFLDSEEKPHLIKPNRHYIYSANNRHWPKDARYHGGRAYSDSFRGSRIDEMLKGDKHDVESFKKIQCDRLAIDARYFLPRIKEYIKEGPLHHWDGQTSDASKELSIFRRFMDLMMSEWKVNEYALYRILDKLDDKRLSELKSYYQRALEEVDDRNWGDLHRLLFPHISGQSDWIFSPEIAGIGDSHTVDPGTSSWDPDLKIYKQQSGASMRMIVEMSERPKVFLILPGLNRQYDQKSERNPWKDWKECRYTELNF